jgi:Zn finger protein HypA/HybF involved in hydrogenase expression
MKTIEENLDENLEEALEKEEKASVEIAIRCSDEEFLNIVKGSLCSCNECKTRFIKRKEKLACPACHSKNVTVGE